MLCYVMLCYVMLCYVMILDEQKCKNQPRPKAEAENTYRDEDRLLVRILQKLKVY